MGLAAALQGSALLNRIQNQSPSRTAYQQMLADPVGFLTAHKFYGNAGNGHQTVVGQTPFELRANGDIRMGINAGGPTAFNVAAILTSTRANGGPGMANRLVGVQRFSSGQGGSQVWLTDQQTGCTVLILDWGGNQFSMVHILPYQKASYGRFMKGVMWLGGTGVEASVQNSYLRGDIGTVVNNSLGAGNPPQRYILVQSQFSLNSQQLLQLIGFAGAATWTFYAQRIQVTPMGQAVHSVTKLDWQTWSRAWPWSNGTS
ncbi:MAG TPA: hypothetical protein VGL00_14540 [Terracidiphilus sp.]